MFDPGSFDACVEVVAHLVLIAVIELSAKKSGYVLGFYGVDGSAGKVAID